jgi:hypothetical protein
MKHEVGRAGSLINRANIAKSDVESKVDEGKRAVIGEIRNLDSN